MSFFFIPVLFILYIFWKILVTQSGVSEFWAGGGADSEREDTRPIGSETAEDLAFLCTGVLTIQIQAIFDSLPDGAQVLRPRL